MKFLVDRCAGSRLAAWLRANGHDVSDVSRLETDPGDEELLRHAFMEGRILVTIDTDFGTLVFLRGQPHCGIVRLPDVPSARRTELMAMLLDTYSDALEQGDIITVRGDRIRVTQSPR